MTSRRPEILTATVQPETVAENSNLLHVQILRVPFKSAFYYSFNDENLKVFLPKSTPWNKFKFPLPLIPHFKNPKF